MFLSILADVSFLELVIEAIFNFTIRNVRPIFDENSLV